MSILKGNRRRNSRSRILRTVLALPVLWSCASVPRFSPSAPVERSESLAEGLLLCHEYRLPYPATRAVLLRPWVECVDQVAELHFWNPGSTFAVFRSELHQTYAGSNALTWSPERAQQVELAVRALFRSQWQGPPVAGGSQSAAFTEEERRAILSEFQQTGVSVGASDWKTSTRGVVLQPDLERLRAGVTGLVEESRGNGVSAGGATFGSALQLTVEAELCRDFMRLRSETDYLTMLWQDQVEMGRIEATASPDLGRVEARFSERLTSAADSLRTFKGRLSDARAHHRIASFSCSRETKNAGKH